MKTSSELYIEISRATSAIGAAEEAHGPDSVEAREARNKRDQLFKEYHDARRRERPASMEAKAS